MKGRDGRDPENRVKKTRKLSCLNSLTLEGQQNVAWSIKERALEPSILCIIKLSPSDRGQENAFLAVSYLECVFVSYQMTVSIFQYTGSNKSPSIHLVPVFFTWPHIAE